MKFYIPYKDRGRVYQRVADELGVSVHTVSQVNNGKSRNLRVLEALTYEVSLYKKWKDEVLSKAQSLILDK